MTDAAKALQSFERAAREASTGLMKASVISRPYLTQSPPLDGYKPMHIPAWWHEEYLKSLEPQPPFDPLRILDDIAVGFANFAESVFRGLGRCITRKDYQ